MKTISVQMLGNQQEALVVNAPVLAKRKLQSLTPHPFLCLTESYVHFLASTPERLSLSTGPRQEQSREVKLEILTPGAKESIKQVRRVKGVLNERYRHLCTKKAKLKTKLIDLELSRAFIILKKKSYLELRTLSNL